MLVASVTRFCEIEEASRLADLVELRLDHFSPPQKPSCRSIFTFRKKEQGGALPISEKERLSALEDFLQMEPEYCDIEADTDPEWIEKMAGRYPDLKWIGSYHNFEQTPQDLDALLQKMKNPHFSIYKIAVKANSTADMLRLLLFCRDCAWPVSAISMGEYGKPSRVLGKVFASRLSYAGLEEDFELGRYSVKQLQEIFRISDLNGSTAVYGLIGDPIEQSPGHIFHNGKFEGKAVYVKMRVAKCQLDEVFPLIQKLGFSGLSVTMPLKESIVGYVEDQSGIGVVNTVIGDVGINTDGIGALDAIEAKRKVKGKKIAILGAGGTAKAIAFEAKKRGAFIAIFNRTVERAQALGKGYCLKDLALYDYDILINTIPGSFLPKEGIRKNTLVIDVVYSPKETPLLQEAFLLGCECVYGEEMFIRQAELQQLSWKSLCRT